MRTLSRSAALPAALCAALAGVALPAQALNILLCNDDGISAANMRALKQQLQAVGHSVIVAAPIDNQSGRGGYIAFLQPVPALSGNERSAKVLGLPAGTAGVGVDPSDADVHYVNGTPVAACLYGIDVKSRAKWGTAPDLVISGPNEGNNTGHINPSSGTFNNLLYAINRGLPALAVSDAATSQVNWVPGLSPASRAFLRLVRSIDSIPPEEPERLAARLQQRLDLLLGQVDLRAARLLLVDRQRAERLQQLGEAAGLAEVTRLRVLEFGRRRRLGEVGLRVVDEGSEIVHRSRKEKRPHTRSAFES